ncbi:MAG: FGGY-family carbohydrate kinase, partial [Armatimonadota bacterium]
EAITVAPKVMWLREHHPDLMSRASRHLLLPDYISLILTGQAFTDVATASSTGLYVEDAPDYSSEALETAGIPKDALAEIRPPGTRITHIRPEIADEWGLDADTAFVSGTNDQYAGALGAGNCRPRILSETTGTCLALVTLTEKLPDALPPGLFGGRFPIARYQFALAYIKTAGLVLDWFVKEFCSDISLADLDSMAAGISPGSRGITVLPDFDGMVSPKPNPDARGTISGLTLAHGRTDIYRAILESLAYGLRENVELMRSVGLLIETVRLIGGGAKSDLWCQIKADVLGMPMERPAVPEAAVLGAAMLAAAGAGAFGSIAEAVDSMYQPDRIFQPCWKVEQDYDLAYKTYLEVSAAMYGN